jgi:putative transposase
MPTYETLKLTKWECKYHIVFIPKRRKKVLYGHIRQELGRVIRDLAGQKECQVEEGHLMADHVHMMISIPPKYSVAQVMGYIKGKTAIHIARVYAGKRKSFAGLRGIDGGKGRSGRAPLHPGAGLASIGRI